MGTTNLNPPLWFRAQLHRGPHRQVFADEAGVVLKKPRQTTGFSPGGAERILLLSNPFEIDFMRKLPMAFSGLLVAAEAKALVGAGGVGCQVAAVRGLVGEGRAHPAAAFPDAAVAAFATLRIGCIRR